ncbi:hypothetical protein GC173_08310, partial [bacterium]|nr:hypothetical protein [bacterium]
MATLSGYGFAAVDMADRTVLLDAPVKPIFTAQPTVEAHFTGPDKTDYRQSVFALEVTLAEGSLPGAAISLNGVPVDSWPILSDGAWLLRIPLGMIREGDNMLRLEGSQVASTQSLRVFSLRDSYEDIHFEMAFTDPAKWTKAQPTPHPTQALVDALHYDLSLRISHANTAISGTVIFTGQVLADGLTSFALDFSPNGGAMAVSSIDQGEGTPAVPFAFSGNFLVMTLPRTYNTGEELVLRISYAGTPATGGVFGAPYVRGTHGSPATPIVYTFSEPYGARFWWPCKDLPDDKAMMDMHIESSKPYITVSNGTLVNREDLGATERWHWHSDFPIPTYLVSICSTNYSYVSTVYTALNGTDTMEIGHYLLPQNFSAESPGVAGTLDAMQFLSETFGEYPFLEHKYTTATHLSGSGMEHTTVTSMPGGDVGIATGSSEPGKGRRNVHELAHHWFGDDVTCRTFDHLWLNEGFATWCEALYYENEYGIESYHSYVNAWTASNTVALVNSNADSFAGSVVYRRGGWVLHMLRNVLGKEEMLAGMRLYLQRHARSTVLTSDFQQAMEDSSGQDLDWFFNQWVYQPGRPTYSWAYGSRRDGADNILTVDITQTQSGSMPSVYTMPVDIVVSDLAGTRQTHRLYNNARTQQLEVNLGNFEPWTVELDPDNWILKNEAAGSAAEAPVISSILGSTVDWSAGTSTSFDVI